LKSNLEKFFSERNVNNVMVLSIIGLLHKTVTESKKYQQLDAKWNYIKDNLNKVKYSLGKFFKENQIDIIIIDEAQDFIPEILRIIFELNSNLVIGIDEGQKIYHYGTSDIKKEVFPDISLQGKVINLRTIYRTPENIAKTAIQILALDDSLHPYYRSEYLERKQEIKYLLPGGRIYKILRQRDIFHQILNYLESLEEDYMVLVPSYKFKQRFNEKLDFVKVPSGKMAYIDSVKGLEADNIIILGFNEYLIQNIKYNTELIYRRLYTMLTRSKKRIFIDLYRDYFEEILNRINKKGEVSSDSLKKLRTAYLTLEKQSIKWSKENQIENLEEKEFTGVLNSISFAKEGFIKTFEKLTPIVEFLANIKGLVG
jgi:superfamily I DNA/RNA helicase